MTIRVQFCSDKNEIISKGSIYSVDPRTTLFELLDKIHSGIVYFLFSVTTRQFYLLQKKIDFAISTYSLHSIHRKTYFSILINIFLCLREKTFYV